MATNLVSIIIPIAPYHTEVSEAAVASARAQTIPCDVLAIRDDTNKGAGYVRNLGISRALTPFVAFLDADDTIRPDFAARMIERWQPGFYVYCDDWQGESLHQPPDCEVWQDGSWHSVTALVPTKIAQAVGGFDESLPAIEDLEFFLHLQARGVCGIRCPEPLLYYTQGGKRSADFKALPDHQHTITKVFTRHIRGARMGCNCGNGTVKANMPNQRQEGDILVIATYSPQRKHGPVTGRLYDRPRGTDNYQLYVDPRDLEAKPEWWYVEQPIDAVGLSPDPAEIRRLALEALGET